MVVCPIFSLSLSLFLSVVHQRVPRAAFALAPPVRRARASSKMVVDVAVVRKVWDGRIPCVFTLSPLDKASLRQPDPIYVRGPPYL